MPTGAGELPRVLVIAPNVFNESIGAGVTLSALFSDWPPGSVAQLHSDPTEPYSTVCRDFFRLNAGERLAPKVVVRLVRRQLNYLAGRTETMPPFFGHITARLGRWIEAFQPQVILSQLGGLPMTQITLAISRRYDLPLVTHISDDWVLGWPANVLGRQLHPLTDYANWLTRRAFRAAIDHATQNLVISKDMARVYKTRYGREFQAFYNATERESWVPLDHQDDDVSPEGKLLYSGSVFEYGQFQSLCDVRDAVASLRADGFAVALYVHTQHSESPRHMYEFQRPPVSILRPLVARDNLVEHIRSSTVLVLPVNFDRTSVDFIRLSLPGKLAEYLHSGRPILGYGPRETAQIEFLERNRCGEVVTQRDPTLLRDALVRLLTDSARRNELSKQALVVAADQFDATRQRDRFRRVMVDAAAKGPGTRPGRHSLQRQNRT